jgi:hypothetical protein
MRKLLLGAAAALLLPALPATAEARPYGYYGYSHDRDVRREQRECRRELRRADSRREYYRELRECRREIARARRDDWRRDDWRHDRRSYRNYERRRGYYGW